MQSLPNLPKDVWIFIFSKGEIETPTLAIVSKEWNQAVKQAFSTLFKSYTQNKTLKDYARIAEKTFIRAGAEEEVDINFKRVKFIFQEIIQKAEQLGYPEKLPLSVQTLLAPNVEKVSKWIEEKEAENLISFASSICPLLSFIREFLNDDKIKQLPVLEKAKEIRTWMQKNQDSLKKIKELDLIDRHLQILPKEIKYFIGLEKLYLSDNQLIAIPSEIGSLYQLQELHLANNQLTAIPSKIGALIQLQELNLNNNRLTAIPSKIGALNQLRRLYLADNRLTAIPSKIGALNQLRRLYLANNRLTALPIEITSLAYLQELRISNNMLTTFPKQIGSLTHRGDGVFLNLTPVGS